ncbi:N-acetylmuramoyl-L-alanine amidase [Streptomyces cellulosae]|uniref:N-acetylmuramoyl-L-alanine amidase n=1 Tax=Streptomyces cellulosae TaxID=1968 RepID=A0ABW6JH14_STRCE
MAQPMRSSQLLTALRAEGLRVETIPGWAKNNRNGSGKVRRQWGPLNGVMIHHTATGEKNVVDLCAKGYAGLPGPLCHGVIHKDGRVTLVGWGRANHAGLGDVRVLNAVIREAKKRPKPGRGTVDGNPRFVGFECVNLGDGKDEWPAVQYEAMVRAAAAICRFYGWNANSVIGHLEWTNQKIDPRGFSMDKFRMDVTARLKKKPSAKARATVVRLRPRQRVRLRCRSELAVAA